MVQGSCLCGMWQKIRISMFIGNHEYKIIHLQHVFFFFYFDLICKVSFFNGLKFLAFYPWINFCFVRISELSKFYLRSFDERLHPHQLHPMHWSTGIPSCFLSHITIRVILFLQIFYFSWSDTDVGRICSLLRGMWYLRKRNFWVLWSIFINFKMW